MKQSAFFITGTDTEVGKTTFSVLLLDYLAHQGLRVCGFKPVASGATWRHGQLENDDVMALQGASNTAIERHKINPYCFEPAIAPHLAAREAGIEIDFAVIHNHFTQVASRVDCVVVEGAGGILVPLAGERLTIDLCLELRLPVIIVVGMRLGCINHALLTEQCVVSQGLRVVGWVANQIHPNMGYYEENKATLIALMRSPLLAEIPYQHADKKNIIWYKGEVFNHD
ncbi:MAG: dethiobiotin synthase [Ferrovum sp. 37-45-19]|uniref:dethiobiotin synthase n=1 Tax=Ferrovum sp. JA12 TaxID=1356299 RepID=UPI000702EC14|nr:dethiobiotin synthase [Ferrovum sp. JA12]OYV79137.1 MAG: dethiobiotin synthase [Ferrovum sp. 21-44-67]OYV93733.1 MAG: dethiobiotin synthase [Ferrovum sp. 37-45-19]OZB32264.1 MAG: dethiobiotin synthase [Ferrovum sp. 34-44-207]HQT81339.1 dethiobiotin synthase [Ferrovaceae bacterium]HQU06227.1 dethiobiotin synthase [Ferrovaceae bacterium]